MQKLRQILLILERRCSERAIAKQVSVSRPTIHYSMRVFLPIPVLITINLLKLSDKELTPLAEVVKSIRKRLQILRKDHFLEQVDYFILELKKLGATPHLLWQEYLETYPSGFQYSRFCELFEQYLKARKPTYVRALPNATYRRS